MIKKFFIIFSFAAFVTNVTTVYGAEETATQKCWYHIVEAKDNMQRKAAIAFKDCVRKETPSATSKLKWPKSADKAEKELEKQIKLEEKERIKAEKKLAKQAKLKEKERIKAEKKAEKVAKRAEKKLLKEKRKKACAANPKSEDCKKATDNIKGLLEKLKKLGGKKTGESG